MKKFIMLAAVGCLLLLAAFVITLSQDVSAEVLPPGGGSGAIFTTVPDGTIVNENVHYEGRHYVYLDGGPKQNAPAHAAGLDEGFYVFQITDPPGKLLLSRDPARCRIVHVNAAGVIDQLMAPTDNSVTDPDGNTVVSYTGAGTDNWQDAALKGKALAYDGEPCHVPGPDPDSAPGTYAPTPDITGVGRHDTNPDVDHNDVGAIVVQMMPYGLTPNPGGVYKAWMTPIQAYNDIKGADLNYVPNQLAKGKQKPHPCVDFCAAADPGFVPSHRYTKTDNFKVTEKFPAEILVRKFHDLNGDGIWQMDTEPEIGVNQCVDKNGAFVTPCPPGGWPYDFTEPLDGGTKTDTFYTPFTHVAAFPGTYSAEEFYFEDIDNGGYIKWRQTASWLDGTYQDPFQKKVDVAVLASAPGEQHEIRFGNTLLAQIRGKKVIDYDADGVIDEGDVCPSAAADPVNHAGCAGVTVNLSGMDNLGRAVSDSTTTAEDGSFAFKDLWPGTYNVTIVEPAGFNCSYPTPCEYTGIVLNSGDDVFLGDEVKDASFADWTPGKKRGMKFGDTNGNGQKDDGEPGLGGWNIHLLKWVAGAWVHVDTTTFTNPDGTYEFTGLMPGVQYAVCEVLKPGWTQTYPSADGYLDCLFVPIHGPIGYDFELVSGEVEDGNDFGNFKNVDVTACKLKDIDGYLATTDDQSPAPGWPVYLTITGVRQEPTQYTGPDGCYTWEDLGPLPAGGYYDVGEDPQPGWIALTDTYHEFESPPQSGASYSFTFVNTPTQGCTPGFWQGGSAGGQAGGRWLWDTNGLFSDVISDPDWIASGGEGANPYNHDDDFCAFFGGCSTPSETMWHFVNPDMWEVNDDFHKAARSLTAAYLNASWGMAYAYTTAELEAMWADALANGTLLDLHHDLDDANNFFNNPLGSCPISASIP
jgi:hypothetical protein